MPVSAADPLNLAQPPIADFVRSSPHVSAYPAPAPTAAASSERTNKVRASGPADLATAPAPASLGSWLTRLRIGFRRRAPTPVADGDSSAEASNSVESVGDVAESGGISKVRDFNPLPPEGPVVARSSDEIFAEIGRELCNRREMLSLTYEEIERHTHVRTAFLAALEQGAVEDLPSPVQTRGILANYAGFMDLDVDTIMLRFADGVQARYREKGPPKPARTRAPMTVHTSLPPLRSFIASDLVFGGGVAIMLSLFAIWGISRVILVRSEAAPRATAPSISEVLVGTALPTLAQQVTVIPAQDTPLPLAVDAQATLDLATLDPNVKVQVKLNASQSTYMRVMVDGKVQFEGRAELGSEYSYQAAEQIEVLVGNAAALRVSYNGKDLGLMGNFGQVIDRLYTITGVATPTSTPQPTRTPTPNVTATPSLTPTITPSVTKTPKGGG